MLHSAKTLEGYELISLDGDIGRVKYFFFDDRQWTIRYLVADTGNWLPGRQISISPHALVAAVKDERRIVIDLTKVRIEASPSFDSDQPITRRFEEDYVGYYGLPMYWCGASARGAGHDPDEGEKGGEPHKVWDADLHSTQDVSGYYVEGIDGRIGHIEDFVIDDETWAIRYLIIATHNWWPGRKILVSPQWIERVSWSDWKVFVSLSREAVVRSPAFAKDSPITPAYEANLLRHYHLEPEAFKKLAA